MAPGLAAKLSELCTNTGTAGAAPDDLDVPCMTPQLQQMLAKLEAVINAFPTDFEDFTDSVSEVKESLAAGPLMALVSDGLQSTDGDVQSKAAELVAKMAKSDVCRCSKELLSLVPQLMKVQASSDNLATVRQTTRAIGNILYENDPARALVVKHDGVSAVQTALHRALHWPLTQLNEMTTCPLQGTHTHLSSTTKTEGASENTAISADAAANVDSVCGNSCDVVAGNELNEKLEALCLDASETENEGKKQHDNQEVAGSQESMFCEYSDDETIGNYPEVHDLRLMLTGLVLNLVNSCDDVTSAVCTPECVQTLCVYLDRHSDEEDIPAHVLHVLACMEESPKGRAVLAAVDVSRALRLVLCNNLSPEVLEACLELATTLAEYDDFKYQLAVGGVCDAILEVIDRCTAATQMPILSSLMMMRPGPSTTTDESKPTPATEAATASDDKTNVCSGGAEAEIIQEVPDVAANKETTEEALEDLTADSDGQTEDCWPAIIQTAADLLVLILLGDASMPVIYGDGQGRVFLKVTTWLSSDNELLVVPAALAMGNFARTDAQSMTLVNMGVSLALLQLLRQHCHTAGRVAVQHAALAALRNLAIVPHNKRMLIMQGALQVLLPLATIVENLPVVFKLLGALRMIVDGNPDAALAVSTCVPVVSRLLWWCSVTDHDCVQAEAVRLLACTIRNAAAAPPLTRLFGPERPANSNPAAAVTPEACSSTDASVDGTMESTPTSEEAPSTAAVAATGAIPKTSLHASLPTTPCSSDVPSESVARDGSASGPPSPPVCPHTTVGIPVAVAAIHSLVEAGCLPPMLGMLQSVYPIMINEASLALSLCLTICRHLPNVLDTVDAELLKKGLENAARRTTVPPLGAASSASVNGSDTGSNTCFDPTSSKASDSKVTDVNSVTGSVGDTADVINESDDTSAGVECSSSSSSGDSGVGTHNSSGSDDGVAMANASDLTALPSGNPADATPVDVALSYALHNLLVACLTIAEIEGGIALLRAACVCPHFKPLLHCQQPQVRAAVDALCHKIGE